MPQGRKKGSKTRTKKLTKFKKASKTPKVKGGSKRLKSVRSSVSKAKTKVGDFKRKLTRAKRDSDKNRLERSVKRENKRLEKLKREEKALDLKIKTKAKKDKIAAAKEKRILHQLGAIKRTQKKWNARLKALGLKK